MIRQRAHSLAAAMSLLAVAATAQAPAPDAPRAIGANETWGIEDDSVTVFPAAAFLPRNSSTVTYSLDTLSGYVHADGAGYTMVAPVNLPEGVLLKDLHVVACDDDDTAGFSVILSKCTSPSSNCVFDVDFAVSTSAAGTPGCSIFSAVPGETRTIEGWSYSYFLSLSTDGTTKIRSVGLRWQRQVSPLETIPRFSDVLYGHPQKQYIDALYLAGISLGCGGGRYCPNDPVTRGQLAVFLARALGLHFPELLNP